MKLSWHTKNRLRHALWEAISGLSVYYLAYYLVSWVDFPSFLQGFFNTNPFSPLRVDILLLDVLTTFILVGCADAVQMRLTEKHSDDSRTNFENKWIILSFLGSNSLQSGSAGSKSLGYNTVESWKAGMFFVAPIYYWIILWAVRHFISSENILLLIVAIALPFATVFLVYTLIYRHLNKQNFAYVLQSSTLRIVDPKKKESK